MRVSKERRFFDRMTRLRRKASARQGRIKKEMRVSFDQSSSPDADTARLITRGRASILQDDSDGEDLYPKTRR